MTIHAATILIVDDEAVNCKLLEALLRPEGYIPISAHSGAEALASVEQHAPDLILLDIMMPGMDGYEVAAKLKANPATASIPIIMVTALVDRATRLAGLKAGAEEFVTKPVDRAELWLRVRNLLRLKAFGDFLVSHNWILEQRVQSRTADLQRFRTAMDVTADAILLLNRNSMMYIEVNATACSMLGYSAEELICLRPETLDGGTLEQLEAEFDLLIAGGAGRQPQEVLMIRKDGTRVPVERHLQAVLSGNEWIVVAILRDISERKRTELRLQHMAHYDALTGLPNRTLFFDTLHRAIDHVAASGALVAVLCIDLDGFKDVNDSLGNVAGDRLLHLVSERLVQCARARDVVGRLGGDQFGLILLMQSEQQGAVLVAQKIGDALQAPFAFDGLSVTLTASIGIAVHPADAADPETLVNYAETAMRSAKLAGRDTYRYFTAQMNVEVLARIELETALRLAVEQSQFELRYQPRVSLASGRLTGLEAQLYWQRPGHAALPRQRLQELLEETGLTVVVGKWLLEAVCGQLGSWARTSGGALPVAVRLSARHVLEGGFDADIARALEENDIPAALLELTLAEGALTAQHGAASKLHNLKLRGVHITLDDFGAGNAGLGYLRNFPIDKLRIDAAIVRDVASNPDSAAVVKAIIGMAHNLQLEVVASGVDTPAQLACLRRQGCDQAQGALFSEALGGTELEQLVLEGLPLAPPCVTDAAPTQTLLLIDDEAHMLSSLYRLLRHDGYHILQAASAAEGLELLALHEVHVILCDQRMPEMSGTVFFDRVKAMYPHTMRLILSGYTDVESILDAINRGAIYRFYTKPWDSRLLRDNIAEVFRHYWLLRQRPALLPAPLPAGLSTQGVRAGQSARAVAGFVAAD